MATQLPDSVEVIPSPHGTLWRLPKRPPANGRGGLAFMLIFTMFWWGGIVVLGFIAFVDHGPRENLLVYMVFGSICLGVIGIGLFLLFVLFTGFTPSYCEIIVDDQSITTIERGGLWNLYRWTTRRAVGDVRQIRIAPAYKEIAAKPPRNETDVTRRMREAQENRQPKPEAIFIVTRQVGRDMKVAKIYGRDILVPLANLLAEKCSGAILNSVGVPTVHIPPPPPTPELLARHNPQFDKPEDSDAALIHNGTDTTIVLPPLGYRGAAKGLIFFGVLWNIFMAVMAAMAILTLRTAGKAWSDIWLIPAAIGVLDTVGIGLILGGVQIARKKTVVIANPTELLISQVGPLKRTERRWVAADIQDIRADLKRDSETDTVSVELRLYRQNKRPVTILYERTDGELAWLAQELKKALKKAAPPDARIAS